MRTGSTWTSARCLPEGDKALSRLAYDNRAVSEPGLEPRSGRVSRGCTSRLPQPGVRRSMTETFSSLATARVLLPAPELAPPAQPSSACEPAASRALRRPWPRACKDYGIPVDDRCGVQTALGARRGAGESAVQASVRVVRRTLHHVPAVQPEPPTHQFMGLLCGHGTQHPAQLDGFAR